MSERRRPSFCIVGGDGAIGCALAGALRAKGVETVSSTRRALRDHNAQFHLDLSGDLAGLRLPASDVVVLTASVTRLAECRAAPEMARHVNVDAQIMLAERALKSGAFVIFLSTAQVFDGTRPNVVPQEKPAPRSVYGRLKAAAEAELLRLGDGIAIIRLGKVIGRHLRLFETWRDDLSHGRSIDAFADLTMAPIAMAKVVAGIERTGLARASGLWHLAGREDISYVDAARHLAARLGADAALVRIASAAAAGIPAEERPPHTALAGGETEAVTKVAIGDARTELDIGLGFADWSVGQQAAGRDAKDEFGE